MLRIFFLPVAVAFPSFREQIPNGRRVACPEGAVGEGCTAGDEGQPASVCNGVGHATCSGETMPLNSFGKDMFSHDFTWTRELCEADSDGDGLTNGEELGDPCCLWEAYDIPSDYMLNFSATHPGVSNTVSDYVRPECSTTAPKKKTEKMNLFNSWEEQRTAEMFINNYSIPGIRTSYVDIALNFPDDSEDIFHAVFAETIFSNKKNLHHYVITGCAEKWPEDQDGKAVNRMEAMSRCTIPFGGWAPGQDILETPSWLGRPLGKAAGILAFVVNVHYDNPDEEIGRVSNDGIRIFYTPTLRPDTLSALSVTQVSTNLAMVIPPRKERFFLTRSCTINVTDPDGQPGVFNLASMGYHAHLLGVEMWSEYTPAGGSSMDLGSEKIWHFDDQYQKNILGMGIKLQTGDHIQSTCVFDSTSQSKPTRFFRETTDEMCWASYSGWPGNVTASCEGHIWTGELEAEESGLGLAARHPEIDAPNVFDGSNLRTGGSMIKGTTPAVCADLDEEFADQLCPGLVMAAVTVNNSCNLDIADMIENMGSGMGLIGRAVRILKGTTILGVCCSKACGMCSDHELCIAAAESIASSTTNTAADTDSDNDTADTAETSAARAAFRVLGFASLAVLGLSFIS